MPYIKSDDGRREVLRKGELALTAGELNYQIFYYIKHNIKDYETDIIYHLVDQFLGEKPNYQRWNDMSGCLIRCYAEIKRRLNIEANELLEILASYNATIDAYEDVKITENGDVE